MSELSKCEYCGNEDNMMNAPRLETKQWQIFCHVCQSRGPLRSDREGAADAWNRIQEEIKIGRKVRDVLPEGKQLIPDGPWYGTKSGGGQTVHWPTEPVEKTGLDWLKSLPIGSRRVAGSADKARFVVVRDGVVYVDRKESWSWYSVEFSAYDWVTQASPETCPEWEPTD